MATVEKFKDPLPIGIGNMLPASWSELSTSCLHPIRSKRPGGTVDEVEQGLQSGYMNIMILIRYVKRLEKVYLKLRRGNMSITTHFARESIVTRVPRWTYVHFLVQSALTS